MGKQHVRGVIRLYRKEHDANAVAGLGFAEKIIVVTCIFRIGVIQ